MKSLFLPAGPPVRRFSTLGILSLLIASAICIGAAAAAMTDGYSWLANAISESAAQGVRRAWIARLGFLFFGFAVAWLCLSRRSEWARGAYWAHMAFGVFMVSTAAFSHKPWLPGVPFDAFEDLLHSVTASGMGVAFSMGVLGRLLQRRRNEVLKRVFDAVALAAAAMMPLLSGAVPQRGGLVQRLMFLVAYVWYAGEVFSGSPAGRSETNGR